jgi:hypothetical protein
MIGLHISVELAGIIGDLDVYSRQAVIVVSRFTALIHASLSANRSLGPVFSMSLASSLRNQGAPVA